MTAADVVTAITDDDAAKFATSVPGLRCVIVPPGWGGTSSAPGRTPLAQRQRRVGILGSFEWHLKQENLRRFVAAADPVFADAGIELVVGGSVPEDFRKSVAPHLRATQFAGWVDDLDAFFDGLRIGVVSEPLGGGFKLKTLDYIFRRVPLAALA